MKKEGMKQTKYSFIRNQNSHLTNKYNRTNQIENENDGVAMFICC